MLEGNLQNLQEDLAQTLRMVSNLASRLTGPGGEVKRQRMTGEEGSVASPSGRDQKRARDGSCDSRDRNLAENPILLD
jgi:hypothetical protein